MKKLDKSYDVIFSFGVISIFFSMAIPNLILPILFVLFVIKESGFSSKIKVLIFPILFFLYFLVSLILKKNFFEDKHIIINILLLIFLMFLALGITDKKLVKKAFVFGLVLSGLIVIAKIIIHYIHVGSIVFGNNETVNELLWMERPYLGFANVIAFIFAVELKKNSKTKWLFNLIILFIVFFLILIVARLALLTLVMISLFTIFKNKRITLKRGVVYAGILIVILLSLFRFGNSFKERFYVKSSWSESYDHFLFQEPRVVIWKCAIKIANDRQFDLIFGNAGFDYNRQKLVSCYGSDIKNLSKRDYYISERFNTHNQFFDVFLSGGLIGIFLFAMIFISMFYNSKRDGTSIAVIFSFVLFCFVENLIWRQWGIYYLGILLPLLINRKK